KTIPGSMVIIGAGVIGCEFACIFRELGTEVSMIEILPRALSTEDHEISELLERELKKKKIRLLTGVKVTRVESLDNGVLVTIDSGAEVVAEKLLVSIGRALNSENLGI